jgi:K+-sensing histidine kinase KdpD
VRIWALLQSWPGRHGVAIVLVAGAVVLTSLLPEEIERRNATLFFGSVMVSAWWGGLGPGLISTVLSAAAIAFFFTPELQTFGLLADDQIRLSLFVTVAALISYLNGARQRAEAHHAALLIREKIGRARSESVEWRYTALADAASLVVRTRDVMMALERLTHLAVPRFATGCAIYVRDDRAGLVPLAATRAPGARPAVDEIKAGAHVLERGRPDVTPELIVVPLVADGRTLGVMSFVAGTDRTLREDDLGFAQDLGHHAALVLARRASMRLAP